MHTNNTGEFTAILEALLWFRDYSDRDTLIVYTDSALAVEFTNGAQSPEESGPLYQIWQNIGSLLDEMKGRISLFKVPAHLTGADKIIFNEKADYLAKIGGDGESASAVGRHSAFDEPTPNRFSKPLEAPPSPTASPSPLVSVSGGAGKLKRKARGGGGAAEEEEEERGKWRHGTKLFEP